MRAVLTNFGTLGDLQPFLALAIEMKRHGHAPVLAFSPYFRARVESLGLDFVPIGPDLRDLQNSVNVAIRETPDSDDRMREILEPLIATLPQTFSDLTRACLKADVMISGATQPAARMVHETTGTPFVSIQTSHFGGIGSPAIRQASAALINPFRSRLGLEPLRDPLTIDSNSPQLALYAMSRHVRLPQADWPEHYHLTGFFFLDDEPWQPEPELLQFIRSGDRPVIISFGSMTHEDSAQMTNLLLDAVGLAGCRAIIQRGWSGLGHRQLPKDVLAIDYIPYHWLFPQAKCIVHHGGGGTAGAVFRSGVPSIFVPHGYLHDQTYWAELAHELGCATQPIPLPQLTAERLAAAIKTITESPDCYLKAELLARRIRSEPGVRLARHLIEDLLRQLERRQRELDFCTSRESIPERQQRSALRKRFERDCRSDKIRRTGHSD
ncbi:MAG TPA: glycosyltransferase [Blastocatellia bacterium]|nr:glycosyltransferase [Blastocatellia bacterium]